jgi:hypothetical protein
LGIPKSVGEKFAEEDPGGKLPEKKGDQQPQFKWEQTRKRTYPDGTTDQTVFKATPYETPQLAQSEKVGLPPRGRKPPDSLRPLVNGGKVQSWEAPQWKTETANVRALSARPGLPRAGGFAPVPSVRNDAGTSEGARKAAQTRAMGGGSEQVPSAAKYGAFLKRMSGAAPPTQRSDIKMVQPGSNIVRPSRPPGFKALNLRGDQTGKFAEIEKAVSGKARDPKALAAHVRAQMIGRPALQRKAAAARGS